MNCHEIQQRISTYLDGALDAGDVSPMFMHLGGCGRCREFIRNSLELRATLSTLRRPAVPPTLDKRILAMNRASIPGKEARLVHLREFWTRRLVLPLPAVAALVLIMLGGALVSLSLWSGSTGPKEQVVYVLSMPAVEVYAPQSTTPATLRSR